MEFMPKLWEAYNQAMNFLMLLIPCVLTLGFILYGNFNRNVMLTKEINPPLCNSS